MMYIIHRHQLRYVLAGLLTAVSVLGAYTWWILGQERVEVERVVVERVEVEPQPDSAIAGERQRLTKANLALKSQREELASRLAILERQAQVKSEAYAKVDQHLVTLQREILKLKEDVAFYRGIVAGNSGINRVRIQHLVIEKNGDERDFRFRVVLTRDKQDDKVVEGTVMLSVDGDQDGLRVRLTLDQLVEFPVADLRFQFKHIQRVEGSLRLPEGFVPQRVLLQVHEQDSSAKPLRESFAWSVINS